MARRLPQILTRDEARALLATPNCYYPTGQRDLCMIKLMLNTGLRSSEVLGLTWHDVDLHTGRLTVRRGKGDKDRQVWVSEPTLELMRAWRARAPQSVYCFPTLHGTRIHGQALREMLSRRGRKAGIEKGVHPHMLRHTYATELYRETKDIRLVQKALGHASLSTTMIYTHIVDDDMEAAMRALDI
jgi:integrase/recombinase XerD